MDDGRFDAFVRGLASGTSRRRFVSGLAGLAVGGWLLAGGSRAAGGIPCVDDGDCPGTMICNNGICLVAAGGGACPQGGTCDTDGDCCPNEVCCFGVCSAGEGCPPGPVCQDDGDCGENQTCVAGRCYIGCVTGDVCKKDSDCCPSETCVNGFCQIKQAAQAVAQPAQPSTSVQAAGAQCPPCPTCQTCPICPSTPAVVGGPVETPATVQNPTAAQTTTAAPTPVTGQPTSGAQAPTPAPTQPAAGGVTIPANVARPTGIYKGSCGQHQPEQAYRLFDIGAAEVAATPAAGGPLGQKTAIPVAMSATTIDAKLSDLLASPYTIDVYASSTDLQTSIACGDIGGTLVGKDIAIGLREADSSRYSGVAWLRDAGAKTLVYIFLGEGLSAG